MSDYSSEQTIELLQKIDLDKLTLGDIRKITSPALRKVLIDLVRVTGETFKPEHTSHGSHTDHLKGQIFDRPIIDNPFKSQG